MLIMGLIIPHPLFSAYYLLMNDESIYIWQLVLSIYFDDPLLDPLLVSCSLSFLINTFVNGQNQTDLCIRFEQNHRYAIH